MKAHIVYDVAGTVTELAIDAPRITVHELTGRGYLIRAYNADGRVIRAVHGSVVYSVDLDRGQP